MYCKKCGAKIPDDAKFCIACGAKVDDVAPAIEAPAEEKMTESPAAETPVEEVKTEETKAEEDKPVEDAEPKAEEAQEEPAAEPVPTTVDPGAAARTAGKKVVEFLRKIPAKVWGVCAAVIIAIIVICNIVSCANGKSPFISTYAKDNILTATGNAVVTYSGKQIEFDEDLSGYTGNYNNTEAAVLDDERTLWAVNTKKAVKIAESVYAYSISFYGDTIVYEQKNDDGYAVFSYNVSKKKSTKIYSDKGTNFVVSPNGKMIAFTNSDGDLMVSRKAKTAKKEYSDAVPCAISNDGKHVFCVKNDKFCDGDDKLCSTDDLYYYSYIYFNASCSEVLFSAKDSTYYYKTKFDEPLKIKGDTMNNIITADNTAFVGYKCSGLGYVEICGVDTLNDNVLDLGGSMYYMSKNGESVEKIVSSYGKYVMSSDGKSIVYTLSGDIYKVNNVKGTEEPKKLGSDLSARKVFADAGLGKIYFLNTDGELRYLKSGKGVLIADDVYSSIVAYDDQIDRIVYLNEDKDVYVAKTTKKSKQKLKLGDVSVSALCTNGKDIFIQCYSDDYSLILYKIKSASKAAKVTEVE